MSARIWIGPMLSAAVVMISACTSVADLVPAIEAVARAAPVIASAAPVVAENIEHFLPSPTPTPPPTGLVALEPAMTLKVGDYRDLLPLLRTLDGVVPAAGAVTWRVDNPGVFSVEPTIGRGSAASVGQTVVTAALIGSSGPSAQMTVEVLDRRLVQEIVVQPSVLTLPAGGAIRAIAEVRMVDGQINGNVQWSSSDNTIATVNASTGDVSALRPGRVTIVAAFAPDTRYKGFLDLTVGAPATPAP